MLTTIELRHWVTRFGVPEIQIQRDHLISHTLAALAAMNLDVVFFGGTALCRTHLIDWRLSEDVDLLTGNVQDVAGRMQTQLPRLLRREFPTATVALQPSISGRSGTLSVDDLAIRLQLVSTDASYQRYPTTMQPVHLRYHDLADSIELHCPTPISATAMKLNAWAERAAPRDLCDLYGLASRGMLDDDAVRLAGEVGTTPAAWMYTTDRLPSPSAWHAALAHQMGQPPDPAKALRTIREIVLPQDR